MTADTMGGVWTYTIDLAEALARHGIRVALATMGAPPTAQQRRQARAVMAAGVFERVFRLEWMDDPWDDLLRAGLWLLELEKLVKPDVVHLNGYCQAALPWRAPTVVVAHSCRLSWWSAVKGAPLPPRLDRYRDEVQKGLWAASAVAIPNRATLRALEEHYGPLPHGIVIPSGRDGSHLVSAAKEPLVLCATRVWDEGKNVAALANAAKGLPWPVFVAGDTRGPGDSEHRAELAPARVLGPLDSTALSMWLARAAIFALPARYEPLGDSVLEAALAGCALVLGDIPSLRETWEGAAIFVAPDDVDGLRHALEGLAGDPVTRNALAERGRIRAATMSATRMADQYVEAYRLLARARPERPQREPSAASNGHELQRGPARPTDGQGME
ncbi:MAG: glycosyltransferase family 4 protein [Deltaproteobacteria bacterium]|nr:glycosyltransferase family 4 protein [Deltaproteobacteria bacterium]